MKGYHVRAKNYMEKPAVPLEYHFKPRPVLMAVGSSEFRKTSSPTSRNDMAIADLCPEHLPCTLWLRMCLITWSTATSCIPATEIERIKYHRVAAERVREHHHQRSGLQNRPGRRRTSAWESRRWCWHLEQRAVASHVQYTSTSVLHLTDGAARC